MDSNYFLSVDHDYSCSVRTERRRRRGGSRCGRWSRDPPHGWGSLVRLQGVEVSSISPPISGTCVDRTVSGVSNEHTQNGLNLVELEKYEDIILVGFGRG